MTRRRAVFDASVLVRAAVPRQPVALEWLARAEAGEIDAVAPSLTWAEVLHALLRYVRGGLFTPAAAQARLVGLLRLPLRTEPVEALAASALPIALARDLSGYDACYLALADAADAVLVTADRRLAEAAPKAELLA